MTKAEVENTVQGAWDLYQPISNYWDVDDLVLYSKGPDYSLGIALPQICKCTEEGYRNHIGAELNDFQVFRKKSNDLPFTQINHEQNYSKYKKS